MGVIIQWNKMNEKGFKKVQRFHNSSVTLMKVVQLNRTLIFKMTTLSSIYPLLNLKHLKTDKGRFSFMQPLIKITAMKDRYVRQSSSADA